MPPRAARKSWCFPELSITGYPPRDLVEKPSFIEANETALQELAAANRRTSTSASSAATWHDRKRRPASAPSTAPPCWSAGKVLFRQSKMLLPNYDVFDEARYFRPGRARISVPSARPSHRADHLRGRLERPPVLEAAPLSARSGGGTVRRRRRNADLHQRLALQHGQARDSPGHLSRGGAPLREARRST